MNVLICGGRNFSDESIIATVIRALSPDDIVIHGGAKGADLLADSFARASGIHTARVDALWGIHGPGAGPIRNGIMLTRLNPDVVIAFPGGRGTKDCIKQAEKLAIAVVMADDEAHKGFPTIQRIRSQRTKGFTR